MLTPTEAYDLAKRIQDAGGPIGVAIVATGAIFVHTRDGWQHISVRGSGIVKTHDLVKSPDAQHIVIGVLREDLLTRTTSLTAKYQQDRTILTLTHTKANDVRVEATTALHAYLLAWLAFDEATRRANTGAS